MKLKLSLVKDLYKKDSFFYLFAQFEAETKRDRTKKININELKKFIKSKGFKIEKEALFLSLLILSRTKTKRRII